MAWTMTSLETLAVLLLFISPSAAAVVNSLSDCTGFLLQEKAPTIPGVLENGEVKGQGQYKIICQMYDDEEPAEHIKRFLTLYDTTNKIPVFSAYKYRGEGEAISRPPWKIEPQLEDPTKGQNMEDVDPSVTYTNQAGDNDYSNQDKYDRGHLFPSSFAFDKNDRLSTFTLTNIVPQDKTFNQGRWEKMEKCLRCILKRFCIDNNKVSEGYVVTGAQPGTEKLKNRVNVPSVIWSAFCCYNKKWNKWLASAFWGKNDGSENDIHVSTLQEAIGTQTYDLFPDTCPRDKNPAQVIKQIKSNCDCPWFKGSKHVITFHVS